MKSEISIIWDKLGDWYISLIAMAANILVAVIAFIGCACVN
jgi:hypothetical protein